MPAPVWVLEPFSTNDAKSIYGVFFLQLMELLAFHDLLLSKELLAEGADESAVTPKALPSTVRQGGKSYFPVSFLNASTDAQIPPRVVAIRRTVALNPEAV